VGKLYGGNQATVISLTVGDAGGPANSAVTGSKDHCLKVLMCSVVLNLFRLHQMHKMQAVATIQVSVSPSVCHALCCANTAERIKVLCEVETPCYPRNIMFDGEERVWGGVDATFAKLISV